MRHALARSLVAALLSICLGGVAHAQTSTQDDGIEMLPTPPRKQFGYPSRTVFSTRLQWETYWNIVRDGQCTGPMPFATFDFGRHTLLLLTFAPGLKGLELAVRDTTRFVRVYVGIVSLGIKCVTSSQEGSSYFTFVKLPRLTKPALFRDIAIETDCQMDERAAFLQKLPLTAVKP